MSAANKTDFYSNIQFLDGVKIWDSYMNRSTSPPYNIVCGMSDQFSQSVLCEWLLVVGKTVNCKRTSTAVKLVKPNRDFEISYVELPPESKRSQALDVSLDILCVSR